MLKSLLLYGVPIKYNYSNLGAKTVWRTSFKEITRLCDLKQTLLMTSITMDKKETLIFNKVEVEGFSSKEQVVEKMRRKMYTLIPQHFDLTLFISS